ncbi:hypothetical protein N5Z71_000095 [Salmonella enterica]|nr:hypothetical protein [Salmonella enterica]
MSNPENGPQLPAIRWPVPKNNRGGEFSNLEEMLAHLEGEATGHWLIGRNGMWHGGIHISDTTTPWCALSGQAMNEAVDFPVPFPGEQAVRCMADGERWWPTWLQFSLPDVSAHNVYYVKYAGFVVKFMRTSLSGTYRRISRLLKFSCGFTITS